MTHRILSNFAIAKIPDDCDESQERQAMLAELRRSLRKVLWKCCRSQQRQVMSLRFGLKLDGGEDQVRRTNSYSVHETAKLLGISPSRVLSLEYSAYAKLKKFRALLDMT